MSTPVDPNLRYKTLPRRFTASLIDTLILAPLLFWQFLPFSWMLSGIAWAIPDRVMDLLGIAYYIIMHAKGGQTVGKRVSNVRVVSVHDESNIGWTVAIRREWPFLIFIALFLAHDLAWAAVYASDGPVHVFEYTGWAVTALFYTWSFADMACTLFNAKHRSLHDYIGGTVVVRTD